MITDEHGGVALSPNSKKVLGSNSGSDYPGAFASPPPSPSCASLYVGCAICWRPVHGVTPPLMSAGIVSSPPATPEGQYGADNGWMDNC